MNLNGKTKKKAEWTRMRNNFAWRIIILWENSPSLLPFRKGRRQKTAGVECTSWTHSTRGCATLFKYASLVTSTVQYFNTLSLLHLVTLILQGVNKSIKGLIDAHIQLYKERLHCWKCVCEYCEYYAALILHEVYIIYPMGISQSLTRGI